ncbi:hypothetical protein [Puia sp.]
MALFIESVDEDLMSFRPQGNDNPVIGFALLFVKHSVPDVLRADTVRICE